MLKNILATYGKMDLDEQEFLSTVRRATKRGRKLKFPKNTKNLRFDADGIYSYGVKVADINMIDRTMHSSGKWSATTSKHYNYAKGLLREAFGFTEI